MNTWIKNTIGLASVLTIAVSAVVYAEEEKKVEYPVETCVVTGMKLGSMGEPYAHEHEGRTIYFCCAGCIGRFEANAEEMLKKLDRKIIEQQQETYPLDVCVVSDEKLGSHGTIVHVVHDNRLVRLCCQGCLADFERNPDRFIKKLEEAEPAKTRAIPAAAEQGHDAHHKHHH